jgi:release factor glutamine methyltransferase
MNPEPSVRALLGVALEQLGGTGYRLDAEVLLAHALRKPRSYLYSHPDESPPATDAARYAELIEQRRRGVPLAYLVGTREFWSLPLRVTPEVLIPRPETERLVELALERVPRDAPRRVADLGTGSGAIALALATERPRCTLVAVDASRAALDVARANARRLGLGNVEFREGSWCAPLRGERFDLIVANPPYVAAEDPHLSEGDLRFEPREALVGGNDGLDAIRAIIATAPACLLPDAWLLIEHGHDQAGAVRDLLAAGGLRDAFTTQDHEGRDRVSGARA